MIDLAKYLVKLVVAETECTQHYQYFVGNKSANVFRKSVSVFGMQGKPICLTMLADNLQHKSIKFIVHAGVIDKLYPTESCTILKIKQPSAASGNYKIYPKELDSPVTVYCDMTSKNGTGVTEIGHDSESRTRVSGYENPASYERSITYNLKMKEIVAIIKQSRKCEQFIKYECHHSVLWRGLYTTYGWWVSRQGSAMNYWGGAAVNSGKCACGMNNTCVGGKRCNCANNDNTLREDSGYLTDKNTLPVTQLRFGDTGASYEYGYHTLGKLRCWD